MCDVIDSKRVFTIIFVFVLREINYTLLAHFRTHTKMYSFSIPFSTFHRYRFSSSKKKSAQLFTAQLEIAKSFSIFLVRTQSAVRINTLMPICKAKKKSIISQSYERIDFKPPHLFHAILRFIAHFESEAEGRRCIQLHDIFVHGGKIHLRTAHTYWWNDC